MSLLELFNKLNKPLRSPATLPVVVDQFQPMMQAINPRIGVTVVPGHGHLGMIADPAAVTAVAAVWRQMVDR